MSVIVEEREKPIHPHRNPFISDRILVKKLPEIFSDIGKEIGSIDIVSKTSFK